MPMYFPDLESVKQCAIIMSKHKVPKKYLGTIPQNESELPKARTELAEYFRRIWKDELQAMEIEEAVTPENYESKMKMRVLEMMMNRK